MNNLDNNSYDISSPVSRQSQSNPSAFTNVVILTTPKTNKSIYNSKSPYRQILKKSKKRDCTPEYSPPDGTHKLLEKAKTENKEINYLNSKKLNYSEKEHKNKFLTLIDECISEVNENYYGLLGNQTTPNIIFKNLFPTKEENLEVDQLGDLYSKTGIDNNSKIHQAQQDPDLEELSFILFSDINTLQNALNLPEKKNSILNKMVFLLLKIDLI
jgi:hypothetical protein